MPCSKEALVWLFYSVSSCLFLLLLFLYFFSTLFLKFVNFIGSYPIIHRNQNGYDYGMFTDEDEGDYDNDNNNENYYFVDCTETDHLVADIAHGGESLVFCANNYSNNRVNELLEDPYQLNDKEVLDDFGSDEEQLSVLASAGSESGHCFDDDVDMAEEEKPKIEADSVHDCVQNRADPTSASTLRSQECRVVDGDENCNDFSGLETKNNKVESNFSEEEKFFIFSPTQLDSNKILVEEKDEEEIFGDSCTVGSTSKSSSEWRSSIKDSGTEDPFSSSSRRSCPRWESYTVFQKYDEEMMFLDRISAQKLHETESMRSIKVCPRSISDRIVHKFTTISKNPSDIRQNPYHELEATYVAQICLTWEALNWSYINFQRMRASRPDFDSGCPALIAQQFQQFQVLLQRYVENEPYEQGRRPEVYARMRMLAPKLLLVPEYRDSEDDHKDEGFSSRISSCSFQMIMEEGIRTFMNFLKADKERACLIIAAALFRRNRRGSVDPALLHLIKKVNNKKKTKLKDLRRARKCLRKKRLKEEEEMEILMGLIDLKVVSRVLRMTDIREQQLHWCEEKMSKVRVLDGKLQRDSSPLLLPAH